MVSGYHSGHIFTSWLLGWVCERKYSHMFSVSVVSDSFHPVDCSLPNSSVLGILQMRILEWGWYSLLQWIFLTQGSYPSLLHLLHWQADSLASPGKPEYLHNIHLSGHILLYVSHAGIKLILKRGKNISQPTVTYHCFQININANINRTDIIWNQYYRSLSHRNPGGPAEEGPVGKPSFVNSPSGLVHDPPGDRRGFLRPGQWKAVWASDDSP